MSIALAFVARGSRANSREVVISFWVMCNIFALFVDLLGRRTVVVRLGIWLVAGLETSLLYSRLLES